MTDYTKKLGTAIATVAILANSFVGVAGASTTITISGNAGNTSNGVNVTNAQTTVVTQNNNATIDNDVHGTANTGNNDANHNNGGNVNVSTGDAHVNATVSNSANQNYANVSCCQAGGNTTVKIAGNAENSTNGVNLNKANTNVVTQNNSADFDNDVNGSAKTGDNDASHNNGGNVSVNTGDASVGAHVSNWANSNSARIGAAADGMGGGDLSIKILNNAEDTNNGVNVTLADAAVLTQVNAADFDNDVNGTANTGNNDANHNNGGNVSVDTGDAKVNASVDNMANFNWADLNCGCLLNGDTEVLVEGNAEDSTNGVNLVLASSQTATQGNSADLDNDVNGTAKTGDNDANNNNGGASNNDPSVTTGDSAVTSDVSSTANLNGLGGTAPTWPTFDWGNGIHISVNFDLSALLAALGL